MVRNNLANLQLLKTEHHCLGSTGTIFKVCFELHDKQYNGVDRPDSWRARLWLESLFQHWTGHKTNSESQFLTCEVGLMAPPSCAN